ncbi:MAG: hypothetical protein ACI8W8_004169, partial [Rhodothermales bacterium]
DRHVHIESSTGWRYLCSLMKALAIVIVLLFVTSCVTTEAPAPNQPGVAPVEPAPTPEPALAPAPIPQRPIAPAPSFGARPTARPPAPLPPSPLSVASERLASLTDQVAEQERLVAELRAQNTGDLEPRIRLRLETELLAELRRLNDLRTSLRTHERLVERLAEDTQ